MKQKQTHSGTMLSANIQQANVINHEIQGQRALHPVLLPWQTLQKCHICTFSSFLWPHWLATSQLQPLIYKKGKTYTNTALHMHFYPYTQSLTLPTHPSLVLFVTCTQTILIISLSVVHSVLREEEIRQSWI